MKKNLTNRISQFQRLSNPKILVQRGDRLGDLVLILPVIATLKQHYPQATIICLCSNRNVKLLHNHPHVNDVIIFDSHKNPTLQNKKNLIKTIKSHSFNLYISLWANSFLQKIGYKANIPLSFGPYINPLSHFYFSKAIIIPWNNINIHESEFNLMMLNPLNLTHSRAFSPLHPSQTKKWDVPSNKPLILIFCNSGKTETMISESFFIKLINALCELNNYHIILTYGDLKANQTLQQFQNPSVTNITTMLDMPDLISLINSIDLYIGPDTGPSHIASYYNKKLILIYKSIENPPLRWGPLCDSFKLVRLEYLIDSPMKQSQELTLVLSYLKELITTPPTYTFEQKKRQHQYNTLRLCWICKSRQAFQNDKNIIRQYRQKGWIITLHLERPNKFKNSWILYKKFKKRALNSFYTKKQYIAFLYFKFYLYSTCSPKLLIFSTLPKK